MNSDLFLIVSIILVCVVLSYLYIKQTKENFESHNVDEANLEAARNLSGNGPPANNIGFENEQEAQEEVDMDDYIKKTDLERAAIASAREYCPVPPNYNPANYIKKTEIDLQQSCPKMPDLKDYVLKSTIPPVQKCPSCVCPKVQVDAGLCKKCPEPKNTCPPPEPCSAEQCKKIVKCEPWQKQVSCPKCPAPEPCPQLPQKVCPAITIPDSNIKCPEPKPCPAPGPCRDGEGRCPAQKEPKCNYRGVVTKSTDEMIEELLTSDDPKLKELLEKLKNKIDINENVSPNNINRMKEDIDRLLNSQGMKHSNEVEPSQTTASTNLDISGVRIESDNNEYGNAPRYITDYKKFHTNNGPDAFDNSCAGGFCPYNTDLNI